MGLGIEIEREAVKQIRGRGVKFQMTCGLPPLVSSLVKRIVYDHYIAAGLNPEALACFAS
jgi:hypothetical protein